MRGLRQHPCSLCEKHLRSEIGVIQHQEVKHHGIVSTSCRTCGKTFASRSGALNHESNANHNKKERIRKSKSARKSTATFLCSVCNRGFGSANAKTQHEKSSSHQIMHNAKSNNNKKTVIRHLNEELKSIAVDKARLKECRKIVGDTTEALKKTNMFTGEIRKAGSVATNSKIGKPDEFDYDIMMKPFLLNNIRLSDGNMDIPDGYAEAIGINGEPISPRDVQDVISTIMESAIKTNISNVDLSPKPHGPAITITIKEPGRHHISVDLTAYLLISQINLTFYQWPRFKTTQVLSQDLIESIRDSGLYLVPKKEKFWLVSTSSAEKELMKKIDSKDGGCRKLCHKLLKRDFQKWNSQSAMTGISTMVFKHVLFWMNEEEQIDWSKENLDVCYERMLVYTAEKLKEQRLPNYFTASQNILEGKNLEVLGNLARLCKGRKKELAEM